MNKIYIERELERHLKALANKRRLAILSYLKNHKEKEATVGDIALAIRLSFKSTSRHLGVLSGANILEKDQRSVQMFYRIAEKLSGEVKYILSLL